MKTKFNRILSSLLVVVMLFGAIAAFIPVSAEAAHVDDVTSTATYTEAEIKAILNATLNYDFETAEEMLRYELCEETISFDRDGDGTAEAVYTKTKNDEIDITGNYLDSVTSSDGRYTIYANNFTGYIYYRDNYTGQIITSNPYNVKTLTTSVKQQLISQVELIFTKASGLGDSDTVYRSYEWAALYSQISTDKIANGIRVNYTLGDTTTRFLLPGGITAECFDEFILMPLIEAYTNMFNEFMNEDYDFFTDSKYTPYYVYDGGRIINLKGYKDVAETSIFSEVDHDGFVDFLEDTIEEAEFKLGKKNANYKELLALKTSIDDFAYRYNLKNPIYEAKVRDNYSKYNVTGIHDLINGQQQILDKMYAEAPITQEGVIVYLWNDTTYGSVVEKRTYSKLITKYCTEFNFTMLYEQEDICSYVNTFVQKPVFRCCIEYQFNDDNTLSITLPSNSIIFDETAYALKSITPLKYFGAGDMSTCNEGGYIFYPDGSGTIIDFKDFYASGINVQIQSQIFGNDYCYTSVKGAHREQVTMPVFGVVSAVRTNATSKAYTNEKYVQNGYFAIFEEGASLAKLGVTTAADFISVYSSYVPYSLDTIQPNVVSVSGVTAYTKVTESKYSGSYVTRIVMLNDPALESAIPSTDVYYPSTYVGMATYYRNYLKKNGVLTALPESGDDLPLYIEVLGALQVTEKFMTFPVSVSKQLTTFEQIEIMYNELSNAEQTFANKSDEYEAMAAAITSDTTESKKLVQKYQDYAALYDELAATMQSISNVNFKLSGFTNGGLTATYPVKLKWERVCGGKNGFKELVAAAKDAIAAGKNLGIYPDFDFMYVNSTAMFDGIGIKQTVARKVDNRYASKQEYNAVTGVYDMLRSMVVSPDRLPDMITKFLDKYSEYDWKYVSASTLGSDLNSNFDEKNPIDRDTANKYVKQTLEKLGEYKVMVDKGNIYSVAYADHILNASIDSSHFRYSSYTVPFVGLVLHGYVNYTGTAFNYTGSPDYDMLRAIENGASLYYILCYENTSYLKEDKNLNKYYGIDYKNWYDSIIKTYNELNALIGGLQNHEIVDHRVLIAERQIKPEEYASNMNKLIVELLGFIKAQTQEAVDAKFDELRVSNPENYDSVKVSFNLNAMKALAAEKFFLDSASELDAFGFDALFEQIVASSFDDEYPEIPGANQCAIEIDSFEYIYNEATCDLCGGALNEENKCTKLNALREPGCDNYDVVVYKYRSAYKFVTGSASEDKDYRRTNYTTDNGNVVIVTYQRTVDNVTDTVRFIINYNNFAVNVRIGDEVYSLSKYSYYPITD